MNCIITRIFQMARFMLFSGILLLALPSHAQEYYTVPRLQEEIDFDGIPDEDAWHAIDEVPLFVYLPVFGAEPSETSILKIAYDDTYFYLGAYLDYTDPAEMRAVGKKRDYTMPVCDWLGIFLDTFYDRENSMMFWTNPNAVRTDGTTKNDMADQSRRLQFQLEYFLGCCFGIK